MKAAVFYEKRDIRIQDFKLRKLKGGEVLLKVHACGVCGTDVHIYEGAEGSATAFPPVILGHEFSGEVCETGDDVKDVKIGDRVCVDPNIFCGKCHYCRKGKVHLCERLTAIGVTIHGGFAEYCIVPESHLYILPDNVSYEEGAMGEPIACCLHGIDLSGISPGDTVLIIGGGTIGLIMLQLAKIAGAARLILSEPVKEKRNLALKLGVDFVVDPVNENFEGTIKKHTCGGVDIAIECVGIKQTMEQAIQSACKGGTVMMFGLTPPDCEISLKPFDVFKRELTIKSSFINPFTQARAVELLASGRLKVNDLISNVVPLDNIAELFENENLRKKGKIIVKPWLGDWVTG
ncbi:MAG: zinc-dependent alcohol dehydrogenase family protein [bacterium]|nr:MAG: zinc-dependent alcohol dehydrogenase family protein [bacterium]